MPNVCTLQKMKMVYYETEHHKALVINGTEYILPVELHDAIRAERAAYQGQIDQLTDERWLSVWLRGDNA